MAKSLILKGLKGNIYDLLPVLEIHGVLKSGIPGHHGVES
jgi:hypothetical protein